jgi:hypothetical protein
MKVVSQFDPLTFVNPGVPDDGATGDGGTIDTRVPPGSLLRMLIINDSPVTMILTFSDPNNSTDIVPAKDRRFFQLHVNTPFVQWVPDQITGNLIDGISQCYIVIYEPSETVVEQYPSPLIRNAVIPTIMQTVQFTGNQNPSITIPPNAFFLGFDISVTQMTGSFTAEKLVVEYLDPTLSSPFFWYYWLSTSSPIFSSVRIPGDGYTTLLVGTSSTLSVTFSGSLTTNAVGQLTAYYKLYNNKQVNF